MNGGRGEELVSEKSGTCICFCTHMHHPLPPPPPPPHTHTVTAMYREDQWPECVLEIREFCLRHIREIKQKKEDKESSVL